MFKPEQAFEYFASATRSNLKTSNSIGVIILLGIIIIWVSQIFPNLNSINTFIQFNSYLLQKRENTMNEQKNTLIELKDGNLTKTEIKTKKRKLERNKTELDDLADTAALKLEGLRLDFELPGFPKLQQVGLQSSIVLWLTMYFLIFRFFFQSRRSFYMNNLKAITLFKTHLADKGERYADFDIHFPFWVMPLPKQSALGTRVSQTDYKSLYNIENVPFKTGLLITALFISTIFFFYNVIISLKLYYSQISYLSVKVRIPFHVYLVLYAYVICCFVLAYFWLRYIVNWFNSELISNRKII
jgi:hypothetical protein